MRSLFPRLAAVLALALGTFIGLIAPSAAAGTYDPGRHAYDAPSTQSVQNDRVPSLQNDRVLSRLGSSIDVVAAHKGRPALASSGGVAAKSARVVGGSLSPTLKAGDRSFIYGDRVLARAKEAGDSYHNFPASFDTEILKRGTRTEISAGYVQYTSRGSVNGVEGAFEMGARPSGLADAEVITHRFFRPGG